MSEVLRHRGPDGERAHEIESASEHSPLRGWFGHRRLKILDLSDAADQPMVSDDGAVALTFNGEIYNFRQLRHLLEAEGHRFRSTGDTEVVLRAYLEWGDDFVERLDGMFALAVWDATRGRLLLARDRVGKKPLFYTLSDGILSFASEIKSLLAAPWVAREPDLSRLPEFLTFGYVPHPATFYRDIFQVPPAAVLVFDSAGLQPARFYWDALPSEDPLAPSEHVRTTVLRLVEDATRRRLVSDVPLGALLSGGVDSSIVVGLMTQLASEPVRTFTAGFPDEPSFDERRYARTVARHFGTEHTEFTVQADALALMDGLLWHHDQPYADSSAIPTYLVSRLAREHVTVILTGDGGDEVFGGYDRFRAAALALRFRPAFARAVRRGASLLPRGSAYHGSRRRAERFFELAEFPIEDRYLSWVSVFNKPALHDLLGRSSDGEDSLDHVSASLDACFEHARSLPALDRILYGNFCTYLPGDLAVKMDRMSMASSLEARSPFLDTSLVEYLGRIPARDKVGIRRAKPLLRRAFAPMLPPEIWERKKHGFGVPVGHWFRQQLGAMLEDELLAPGARSRDLFDQSVLRRLWGEHLSGARDHGPGFWTLLTLEHWLRSCEVAPTLRAADEVFSASTTTQERVSAS